MQGSWCDGVKSLEVKNLAKRAYHAFAHCLSPYMHRLCFHTLSLSQIPGGSPM